MLNTRRISLCAGFALILSVVIPHVVLSQTVRQGVPNEYQTIAKHLAAGLHNSLEAARQHYKRPTHDYVKEFDRLIFDLGKIETDDPDIKRLVSLALPAAEEFVLRLNNIHSIPRMSDDEAVEYVVRSVISGGLDNTGYKKAASRRDAIKEQEQKLNRAALEFLRARHLLPAIAKKYAPPSSKSSSLQVGFYELPPPHDIFHITNNGDELQDCTLEIKIKGKSDTSVTSVYFVDRWAKGATLWTLCTPESGSTVFGVETIEVSVLSPNLNTTINYSYDRVEKGKTHAWLFKDVKFLAPSYQPREPGIFSDYQRSFRTYIEGYPKLPKCRFTVTFRNDLRVETFYKDYDGWSSGTIVDCGFITPGNDKLIFEPRAY